MPDKKNIVIIGGTACGPKTAARARRMDQNANITLIEQRESLSSATCGMPYYLSGAVREGDLVTRGVDYFRNIFKMTVHTGTRAVSINTAAHKVEAVDIRTGVPITVPYDKLVIATGASPFVPAAWQNKDLKGIFTLNNIADAVAIHDYIVNNQPKNAVIVGAGLIGLETAENFVKLGIHVTILEALGWPLPGLLDYEMAAPVEKHLKAKGVNVLFGQRVTGFEGADGTVKRVMAGTAGYEADIVLMSLGVRPNVTLAKEAGLKIGALGGIDVNEFLQTSNPDIYAGGDCVELTEIVTGKRVLAPLGSTANKHGRIIGTNITGGKDTFPGIAGTAAVKIFDLNVGKTGLTEKQARDAGLDFYTALIPQVDHANYYPGAKSTFTKLIAEKKTGKLLGGQMVGPGDTIKRLDVLATALTFGANVDNLANLDLAYAPPYNSAMDPLHNAANVIRNKARGDAPSLSPQQVKEKMVNNEDFILLDVRSQMEWNALRIPAPQLKLIPLPELRKRLDELPPEKEIITMCAASIRAYQALRILVGAGYKNVKFMDGSMQVWPYETESQK
jgi:NADPH-dependent 2,4-dienoyl-CoA reductase/sulfur reductase-like enzyme/rhodanese-related sulfurtransferase